MRQILLLLFFAYSLFSNIIEPNKVFTSFGNVTDFVVKDRIIYSANSKGRVEFFNLDSGQLLKSIDLEKIKNYFDELKTPKIFSIDVSQDNKIIILSEGTGVLGVNLYLYENEKLIKLIDEQEKVFTKEVRFYKNDLLLFSFMSSEIALFDINSKKFIYKNHYSTAVLGDMEIDSSKELVAISDEGGIIRVAKIATGEIVNTLQGANKDNVYKIDFKQNTIITAGQDRICGIYDYKKQSYKLAKSNFLIYSVGLSPSANIGAYILNENNEISIIDTKTTSQIAILKGHNSTINKILFINETELLSSSDDKNIIYWRIK